jgi:ankyrin repeat protein/TolA-binding protein
MKTKLMSLTLLLTAACDMRAATNDLTSALQKGLFEEEANHNLTAAIEAYQSVIGRFDQDRKLAATAIFRLGECYRKQGNTNDAAAQYERVMREFADQKPLSTLSSQNLTLLGSPRAASRVVANAATAEAEAAALQRERLLKLPPAERRIAVQQNFPNPVLTSLMQRLQELQQQLVTLQQQVGAKHPDMLAAQAAEATVIKQIDAQVQGVLDGLEAKAKASAAVAAALEQRPSIDANGNPVVPATSSESEEVRRIQAMIKDSPDLINAKDNNGWTPLQHAAAAGQLVVARFLLDNRADVDAKDGSGRSPLHQAAENGHKGMVELLLAKKAGIQTGDDIGKTPLHVAAEKGFKSIVELLLDNGANVNATTKDNATALHFAAANGFKSVAEVLLAHRADPNISGYLYSAGKNFYGTPLHAAAYRGDRALAELLLANKSEVDAVNRDGATPLDIAAFTGATGVAELLLSHGADVNAVTSERAYQGWTPLIYAVNENKKEMVDLLLEHKANPNVRYNLSGPPPTKDFTPLLRAAINSPPALVESLLAHKADPNLKSDGGNVAIIYAMGRDATARHTIVASLLNHGAGTEVRDERGQTPLIKTVQMADKETTEALLAHKADVNARDPNGSSPLEYAVFIARSRDALRIAELLLSNGADPNAIDNGGRTPLQISLETSRNRAPGSPEKAIATEMVALLREHGAVENLPRMERIEASRASVGYSRTVFSKGTNDWNRFTLLELMAVRYQFLSGSPDTGPGGDYSAGAFAHLGGSGQPLKSSEEKASAFPDLTRIRIRRPSSDLKGWNTQEVDCGTLFEGGDCSQDIPLQWGDVVEIPEADHRLNEPWSGFSRRELASVQKCLTRTVQVLIKGQRHFLELAPDIKNLEEGKDPIITAQVPFWIRPALRSSNLLLASSDLTRIKVTRNDPPRRTYFERMVDCSDGQPAPDLWLRDGDIIDVPEKQ